VIQGNQGFLEYLAFLGYRLYRVILEILDIHLNLDNHHYQVYLQSPDIPHCLDTLKDT
jgi:hypothetical protein